MRSLRLRIVLPAMIIVAGGVTTLLVWRMSRPAEDQGEYDDIQDELSWAGKAAFYYENRPTPVAANRGPEVLKGFRGKVHPLLHGQTRLELKAYWTPVGEGRFYHRKLSENIYSWFTSLQPAQAQQLYTERDFSGFLPAEVGEVGQRWALDRSKVVKFLKQFHPRVSMHQVSPGRLAGPEGAFGILRAVSPTHLDIAFRIHAEFYVTPAYALPPSPLAWYTPSYLAGNMLVNKETGTVDYFRLALPTDKALNVFLSLIVDQYGEGILYPDVVPVERMELVGGNDKLTEKMTWTTALPTEEARRRLARVFYKFGEIEWVPFDQAVAQSRKQKRPICAVVSWGSIDGQSC